MSVKKLPEHADTSQLRAQAKELRRAYAGGSPAAAARVKAVHPHAGDEISLRDAQLVIAREHDFAGWRDLVEAVVAQQSGGTDLHRWFGVELNNGTWDALGSGLSEHSPQLERERALYAAYASTYHWMHAGTVANHGRGEYMIASVAVAIGLARRGRPARGPLRRTDRRAPGRVRRLGPGVRRRGPGPGRVPGRPTGRGPAQGRGRSGRRRGRRPRGPPDLPRATGRRTLVTGVG